ncbi:hypothetical protein WS68_02135 [Burkholderia sp. TSV86]|nr:hypothetical protein WS68_02135 [Burkholderia sp. TSV86]
MDDAKKCAADESAPAARILETVAARGRLDGWPSVAKTPASAHTGTQIVRVTPRICAHARHAPRNA